MSVAAVAPSPVTDYAALYADYWSRPDRWGASSFPSAEMLAHQVLVTCGPGSVLDVGCGMGELVRTLLAQGIDARGVDIAERPIAHAAAITPGRFTAASLLDLPFEDGSFDTVVCTDCLEHLAEADIPRAIAELARVARRSVFLTIGTRPDRDGVWHLTIRDRAWWEQRLLAAGFRKHPAAPGIQPFAALEHDGASITVVMEKIPRAAAERYPLQSLRDGRDLHMDMLRESGRRSDAHIARYALAAGFVRRGDVVLDAACGLGYGAAVLSRLSGLAKVVGLDSDEWAVRYAHDCFTPTDPRCEFRAGDAHDLSFLPDASIDTVVSMETLEHLADPARFLAEVRRVLRPGGRFIASVPNDWTDDSGRDPNPHHLHVYTWRSLADQLAGAGLLIERAYAQVAGGGMKHTHLPRSLTPLEVDPRGTLGVETEPAAEWWLAVAMRPATGTEARSTDHAAHAPARGQSEDFHPLSFGRDYANPWIGDAMVMIGHRATSAPLLQHLAHSTLAESAPTDPDAGAALCVRAYRTLEPPGRPAAEIDAMLAQLAEFDRGADGRAEPHLLRWRISNRFVAAKLLLALGRLADARAMFLRCAELDPTPFSPLLATKTVEALYFAGLLAANQGDPAAARDAWQRGLSESRRALAADWRHVWDDPARPAPFAMHELGAIADAAAMCAGGLNGLAEWTDRPGRAWRHIHAGTKADFRSWVRHLEEHRPPSATAWNPPAAEIETKVRWLEQQMTNWRAAAEQRDGVIAELKSWTDRLSQARTWLEGQVSNWKGEAERRAGIIDQLKSWTDQLAAGKSWLEDQCNAAKSRLDTAEQRATEAERASHDAVTRLGQRAVEHAAEVTRLQTAVGDKQEEIRLLKEQLHAARQALKQQETLIRSMQTPAGVLRTGASVVLRAGRPPAVPASSGPSPQGKCPGNG